MDNKQKPFDSSSRSNFNLLIGHNSLILLARQFSAPNLVLPWIVASIGAPHLLAALILPLFKAGSFFSQLLAGAIVSAFRQRKWIVIILIFVIGCLLLLVSTVIMRLSLVWVFILFPVITLVMGFSKGIAVVASQDVNAKSIPKEQMGKLLSLVNSLGGFLTLCVAALTHFLGRHPESMPSHLTHIWMGAAFYATAGLLLIPFQETESPITVTTTSKFDLREDFKLIMKAPWFIRFMKMRVLFLSVTLALPFYAIHATTLHNNSASNLSVFIFATALGALVSTPVWGPLLKQGLKANLSLSAAMAAIAGIYCVSIEFVPRWQTPYMHAPAFFLIMLANKGLSISTTLFLQENLPKNNRPRYLGLNGAIIGVIGIAGAFLIGLAAQMTHISIGLMVLIALNIVAGLFAFFFLKP